MSAYLNLVISLLNKEFNNKSFTNFVNLKKDISINNKLIL